MLEDTHISRYYDKYKVITDYLRNLAENQLTFFFLNNPASKNNLKDVHYLKNEKDMLISD